MTSGDIVFCHGIWQLTIGWLFLRNRDRRMGADFMDDRVAVELDNAHLRKLQLELLELLVEFDRICREAGIRYYLSSGTLLGAVRHQGFIPWDDDADVDMLREDYDLFCQVVDDVIDQERFFFQNTGNDKGYRWVYGKLRRKDTEYIRVGHDVLKQRTGICLDIFPLDNAYDDWRQVVANHGCRLCRKVLWAPVGARYGDTMAERVLFRALSLVPRNWALAWHRRLAVWQRLDRERQYIISHNSDDICGRKYQREWFAQTVEMGFENYSFWAPQGFDGVLRVNYGNYMDLPPLEARQGPAAASVIRFSDGEELRSDQKWEDAVQ